MLHPFMACQELILQYPINPSTTSKKNTTTKMTNIQRSQWWNWYEERLKEIKEMFTDIDGFIKKWDVAR